MKEIVGKISRFMDSDWYIYAVAAFTFVFSCLPVGFIGMVIVAFSVGFALIVTDSSKPVLVGFAFVVYSFNQVSLEQYLFPMIYSAIAPLLLVVAGMIYRFIRLKRSCGKLTLGDLGIGLIVMAGVCVLGGLFTHFNLLSFAVSIALGAVCFAFYLLLVNTMKFDFKEYMAKIIVAVGVVILLQLLWFYATTDDFWYAVKRKAINIGWGVSNDIGLMLAFSYPMALYLSLKSRRTMLMTALALVLYLGIFFSFSRGNILFATVLLPFLLVYTYVKTSNRRGFLLTLGGFVLIALLVVLLFPKTFFEIFESMFNIGLDDRGRVELYERAVRDFLQYPLFGVGFYDPEITLIRTHCTPLQMIQSCGIVGLIGSSLYFFQRYRNLFHNLSMFKIFAFCAILLAELYGLMDLTFMKAYLIFLFYAVAVASQYETDRVPAFSAYRLKEDKKKFAGAV